MVEVMINKKTQDSVVKMYVGTKKEKAVKNVRKIAETLKVPRRQVMTVLQKENLAVFADASFR